MFHDRFLNVLNYKMIDFLFGGFFLTVWSVAELLMFQIINNWRGITQANPGYNCSLIEINIDSVIYIL